MLHIGTAGYSYKDWIGPFYPEGTKDIQMLEYYSLHFDFVEVNSSFYHMPRLQLFESLNRKTPDRFRFSVKLFGGFTHQRTSGPLEAEQFKYSVKPLTECGKLICLLAQFPYSFKYNQENMDHLKRLRSWFEEYEINIEFRNNEWISSNVMDMLKNENLGYVCVDEPGIKGLVKKVTALTSNVFYLRMHGRNAAKWYGSEGAGRYDYLYTMEELMEWVPRIKELGLDAPVSVISFNNHPIGKAVQNAKMMAELMKNY